MKIIFTLISILSVVSLGFAQNECGQAIIENQLRVNDADLNAFIQAYDDDITYKANLAGDQGTRAEKIIIPVVFHIIHMNGSENISDAQVRDAIRIMNEDFNLENEDQADVVTAFQNIIGNAEIEFRLAAYDPSGDPTSGIDRIESPETFVGDDGSKLGGWPRSRYYNIWVTDVIYISGAAAYAYRPPAAHTMSGVDGVISNHRYVGSIGTGSQGESARTLTHETGHYLGLPHTWGGTNTPGCDGTTTNSNDPCFGVNNCLSDDGISDTPLTIGVGNSSCNTNQSTCGSTDNIQNYMDYSSCSRMFTDGQVNVMRSALNSSTAQRSSLWTSSNHANTGVTELTEARFYVERRSICRGETVDFIDESRYDPDSWTWEITGPESYSSTDQNPSITFKTAGEYTVKLTVFQGSTSATVTEEKAIVVSEAYGMPVPFFEDFSEGDSGWFAQQDDDNLQHTWQYNTGAGFDDNFSYKMFNIGQEGNRMDELIFSSIDMRPLTDIDVSFEVAYKQISSSNGDVLQFYVSEDCGDSWDLFWASGGSALSGGKTPSPVSFTPSSASDWEHFEFSNVSINSVSGNTLLKFRFVSDEGNHLYIDNINIDGTYSVVPQLRYPSDGAVDMNDDVILDWHAAPGVDDYLLHLDKSANFNTSALQTSTITYIGESSDDSDTRYVTSDLEHGATYYWRVRTKTGGISSVWSDTWSFTVADDGVGIVEADNQPKVLVFPNPTTGVLNISSFDGNVEHVVVKDMMGREALRMNDVQSSSLTLSLFQFPKGMYMVEVATEKGSDIQRIIVE